MRSNPVTFNASAGAYALDTSANSYEVSPGNTLEVPITLQVTQPLYYPNVALDVDEFANPSGMVTRFAHDYTGDATLRSTSGTVAFTVQGAAAEVVTHRDADVQAASTDVTSANLLVTVSQHLAPGSYQVTISGVNGQNEPISNTVTIVVKGESQKVYLPLVEK